MRKLAPHRALLNVAFCFAFVFLSTYLSGAFLLGHFIWVGYGIALSYLLLATRRRWIYYLLAAFAAHILAGAFSHIPWIINVLSALFDFAEAPLAAWLLRPRSAKLPNFSDRAYTFRFLFIAILLVPGVTGLLSAALRHDFTHVSFWLALLEWTISNGLGASITTPACVAIFRFRRFVCMPRDFLAILPYLLAATLILSFEHTPIPFLLYPLLLLVLLRFGLGLASASTLFVVALGSWNTTHGIGPFAALGANASVQPTIVLQLFVGNAMFMIYAVNMVIQDLRATQQRLEETAALHDLVMENSRDVIIISDFEGNPSVVSAAGDRWGGWTREELRHQKSIGLIHPDDRAESAKLMQELKSGKEGALIEYRIRCRDNSYVWIESSVRSIRHPNTGVPTGVLISAREISARKSAEQKLAEAYHAVETLAATDALTGLANRRRFDQMLNTEWRRATRDRSMLALLLIDADLFKSYNDAYGHLRGDSCLKQIAEAAQIVISRPGDLVARFGGEEFAVILPGTNLRGAKQIAEAIRAAIQNRGLPHAGNPAGAVTVSVGCAALVPRPGQSAVQLIDNADQALYEAKKNGRNSVCVHDAKGKLPEPKPAASPLEFLTKP